ncbi:MAG: HNH endonuclease [Gammaproteobacteria bacterium]|nr:HNH endonuclease [Gammaproteobacteria bacterium]MYE31000.1 HNH endonuclease [Gammaproteobacteria bacterium]
MRALLALVFCVVAFQAAAQDTWRGLTVAQENRCSDYDSQDYSYPQSVEDELTALYGGAYSPYTGEWFDSDAKTDIEHIVARSEAHDSGLCSASHELKRTFARDLLDLTLADPGTNRDRKSAKDAAEWLPDLNRCWFANRVLGVKLKYNLTVDPAERDALEAVLAGCDSFDLVIYPPNAGPLSGIYTSAEGREAVVITQSFTGETISLTLFYEIGPAGEIIPGTWQAEIGRIEEAPVGYSRHFPSSATTIIAEKPASARQ